MKPNVGRVDALMRITIGLTGVAWGTARMVQRPHASLPMIVTFASAMKVAEGVTRFCPLTALFSADYDRLINQAKDKLPIQRFTKPLERQAEEIQDQVQNAVQDAARNMNGFEDDFEPHH